MTQTDNTLDARPECRAFCWRYYGGLALLGHIFNAGFKTGIGLLTGSLALTADGCHSLVDAVTGFMAIATPRLSKWRNDDDGPAGPGKMELAVVAIFSTLLVVVSLMMIAKGFIAILGGRLVLPGYIAAPAALVSILLNVVLSHFGRCVGAKTNDAAIMAADREHRMDILSSWIALAGILAALIFKAPFFDPLAAIVVGLIIPHVGYAVLGDVIGAKGSFAGAVGENLTTQNRKTKVAMLSVLSNSLLVLSKLVIGVLIGSVSVISEAIHSGVDLLAAMIAFFAVRTSGRPEDKEHPFGHGKIENLSGAIEALLIFVAAGYIIYEAVQKLIWPHPLERVGWGIIVMMVSAFMNMGVSHYLFKVGKETDSMALQADAWHLRTDVWTSVGVMGGLSIIWVLRWLAPTLHVAWVDPVAAIVVAFLIFRAALHLTIESGRDLLDASLPESENAWIRDYLTRWEAKGYGFRHLRTRKAGATRFVEFNMVADAKLSVEESHQICESITNDIKAHYNAATHVIIHVEPETKSDAPSRFSTVGRTEPLP